MRFSFVLLTLAVTTLGEALGEARESPDSRKSARILPERPWKVSEEEAASWTGPFASALRVMLKAGFPDPSGLPFHRIGIVTGNCYTGDDGVIETTGWILAAEPDQPTHAIAWNGLVYPIVEDQGKVDFDAEVARMMTVGENGRAGWHDTGEATQATLGSLSLIHGLYLTRLGHPDAAEYVLKNRDEPLKSPPLEADLAIGWIWSLYERAICAHMRGDPNMALASLAVCRRAMDALEKALKSVDPMFGSFAAWKEEIPGLEAECERRLKAGKVGAFDARAFVAAGPGVPGLIDALDRIAIPQDGQPADVPLWESEVVKALVKKGDQAVEPLLACLVDDPRLTQSVHFWRSFHRSRTILGVHEAALYALQGLLEKNFLVLASTGDSLSARDPGYRKELAATIRAAWEKYDRATGVRRAFRVLKDDGAGIDAWMDAGNSLFPTEEYDEERDEWVLPKGPIPGEVLRNLRAPSVSDLLEKRANQAGDKADRGDKDAGHGRMALLAILLEWDPERGKSAITRLADRWMREDSWSKEDVHVLQRFIAEVAKQVPEILPVFESMAWSLDPDEYDRYDHRSAFVTGMVATHGAKLKRADLWTDPDSPWCLHKLDLETLESVVKCWRERELAWKPPFDELILGILDDDSPCGEVYINEDAPDTVWLRRGDGSMGSPIPEGERLGVKPGGRLAVRRKDVAARMLEEPRWAGDEAEGTVLEYHWPVEDRDAAATEALAAFKSHRSKPDDGK